jgi:16S rRNA (guanine527-N7)-methyltransferase
MVPRESPAGQEDAAQFRKDLLIAAEGVGRPLTPDQADQMTEHYRLLKEWSSRMNLTGLKDRGAILRRHFLEPILAGDLIEGEGRLIDIGSGNGFPGAPLAVLHPGLELVLVESSEKKSTFLWMILRGLGLKAAQVVTRRVCRRADLAEFLPSRWVTYRAIRGRDCLGDPGPDLLEPGGGLIAFVSADESDELRRDPPPGLRFALTRDLSTSPGDVAAILRRAADPG